MQSSTPRLTDPHFTNMKKHSDFPTLFHQHSNLPSHIYVTQQKVYEVCQVAGDDTMNIILDCCLEG